MATTPSQVKPGDLMTFAYWSKVKSVHSGGTRLLVENVDNKEEFSVEGASLVEKAFSADRYSKTETVSKTEAAEKLVSSFNVPFTVVFEKSDGTNRVLRGRLVKTEPLLGRSMVEDLDVKKGNPLRQVDHRTIESLVVNGVRYVVKK